MAKQQSALGRKQVEPGEFDRREPPAAPGIGLGRQDLFPRTGPDARAQVDRVEPVPVGVETDETQFLRSGEVSEALVQLIGPVEHLGECDAARRVEECAEEKEGGGR